MDGERDNWIAANGDEGGGVLACALRKRGQRFWPIMILSGQAQMADAGRFQKYGKARIGNATFICSENVLEKGAG